MSMSVAPEGAPAPDASPTIRLAATERLNDRHRAFVLDRAITVPRRPLLRRDAVLFTMGSCFAEEVRRALSALGWRCAPRYRDVAFDPARVVVDTLPDREHMNFYNSFSVRQQIESILGLWSQDEDDMWRVGRLRPKIAPWSEPPTYQDPYLRLVLARSPEELVATVAAVKREMRRGFEAADAFVFTFGMTEVFVNRGSGRVVCQKPAYGGAGGEAETDRLDSSFAENLDNIRTIIRLIRREKPHAPIFLSVSPVALERTFSGADVVAANMEGKSILRAAVGQVAREFEDVVYFPSYELVTLSGAQAYRPDFRHVLTPVVDEIMTAFVDAFATDAPSAPPRP